MQRYRRLTRALSLKSNKIGCHHRLDFLSLPDIREDVVETITISVSLVVNGETVLKGE